MTRPRNKADGRYIDRTLEKLCVCSHRLGEHTADRAGTSQPCLRCECESFTAQPRVRPTAP